MSPKFFAIHRGSAVYSTGSITAALKPPVIIHSSTPVVIKQLPTCASAEVRKSATVTCHSRTGWVLSNVSLDKYVTVQAS